MLSGAADPAASFFTDPNAIFLAAPETVRSWGKTLVVAPHPDDESLGCGGAIALLRRSGIPVSVLFISDGTGSHPNSHRYPPPVLRDLRESEALQALEILGVPPAAAVFLRIRDGLVPSLQAHGFSEAADLCGNYLRDCRPQTILLPWRRDPHPDHRATSQILQAALGRTPALSQAPGEPRLLEYPIWAWERAVPDDVPRPHEVNAFRLDVHEVAAVKRAAVDAHQSQVTHMIDDDPHGFWLSPEVLAHFERSWEMYLEVLSW